MCFAEELRARLLRSKVCFGLRFPSGGEGGEPEETMQTRRSKKEEFLGFMGNMLPGNSFPRSALFLYAVCGKNGITTRALKDSGF